MKLAVYYVSDICKKKQFIFKLLYTLDLDVFEDSFSKTLSGKSNYKIGKLVVVRYLKVNGTYHLL